MGTVMAKYLKPKHRAYNRERNRSHPRCHDSPNDFKLRNFPHRSHQVFLQKSNISYSPFLNITLFHIV